MADRYEMSLGSRQRLVTHRECEAAVGEFRFLTDKRVTQLEQGLQRGCVVKLMLDDKEYSLRSRAASALHNERSDSSRPPLDNSLDAPVSRG